MKRSLKMLGVLTFALVLVVGAWCSGALADPGNTAVQTVTYAVSAINQISVSGNPEALTVSIAVAGSEPGGVSDSTTTYSITTNGVKKITGVLDTAMPEGVILKVNLAAPPTTGISAGDVTLSEVAADLVTAITKIAVSGRPIIYKLDATLDAGEVSSAQKTVTFTISN